jgi:tetraacyldisaccharide 4'-kinase
MSGQGARGVPEAPAHWNARGPTAWALWPPSLVFRAVAALRRGGYRATRLLRRRVRVPVVVVGNLTVGGSGKTPLVVWLAEELRRVGLRPGIVSRGYGGRALAPTPVTPGSDPAEVGDEPVLLAARAGCPVYVGRRRAAVARALLKNHGCEVILSDDGLQHYALRRDIEIVVIDGQRRFGNGFCLPAGPLREPASRLREVDYVLVNGRAGEGEFAMGVAAETVVSLSDTEVTQPLAAFRHQRVHAVAGIGHPQRFFDTLRAHGLEVEPHAFPDHHAYRREEIAFGDGRPVLMTEKDAVKCRAFATEQCWFVPVQAVPDSRFAAALLAEVRALAAGEQKRRG